jgi:uncharacterized membrane protein YGL010W
MRKIDFLLSKYGESHQNKTNKLFHWFCIPAIMFSFFGILMSIPLPIEKNLLFNLASTLYIGALIYYISLSLYMFIGFLFIGFFLVYGNYLIYMTLAQNTSNMLIVSLIVFIIAWIGQFIGHKIEGKKPSFLEDVQYLLIGPAWLLHFIFTKLGLKY